MIRDSERRDPGLLFYNIPTNSSCGFSGQLKPTRHRRARLSGSVNLATESIATTSKDPVQCSRNWPGPPPAACPIARGTLSPASCGVATSGGGTRALPSLIVDRSIDNGFCRESCTALRTLQEKFPAARRAVSLSPTTMSSISRVAHAARLNSPRTLKPDIARTLPLAGGFALDLALPTLSANTAGRPRRRFAEWAFPPVRFL